MEMDHFSWKWTAAHGDMQGCIQVLDLMSPESYEKIWKENFLLSGIHSLV